MKKTEDILRAERERQSRDLWKVYNPTNQDFSVVLNAKISPEVWTIHSKTEEIVPMYVMKMYFRKMSDLIIYSKTDKAIGEEKEKRMAKGFAAMNLHTEQFRFESQKLKTMMTKKDKLKLILVKGLYKEYGIGESQSYQKNIDRRSFATESEVDVALGSRVHPKVEEKPEIAISEAPKAEEMPKQPKKTPYEVKVDNLAKARAAKKAKNVKK